MLCLWMPAPAVPPTESAAVGGIRIPARWKRQGSLDRLRRWWRRDRLSRLRHDNDLRLSVMLRHRVTARLAITPRECRDPQGCNVGGPPAKRAPGTGEGVTGAHRAGWAACENPIRFPMMGSMAGGGSFSLPSARNAPTTGAAPCRSEQLFWSVTPRAHARDRKSVTGAIQAEGSGSRRSQDLTSASPERETVSVFACGPLVRRAIFRPSHLTAPARQATSRGVWFD